MSRRVARAVSALLLLVLTACTGGAEPVAREAVERPRSGGTITVGIEPPVSLDPSNAADAASRLVVSALCDPLIAFDPVTGEPAPAIAASWAIGDRGRRITVRLRRGVRFHDGTEVTADDAVYALSRVASVEHASLLAGLLRPVVGFEVLHGEEETDDERFRETLRGTRPIDTHTFEILLKEPNADFLRVLAHPLATPVPKRLARDDPARFERRPVCTGPYRLTHDWAPGDRTIRLERFEGYAGISPAFTGSGYADALEFRVYRSPAARARAFRRGRLDVAHAPAGGRPSGVDARDLVVAPGATLEYIGLPVAEAPFDQRAVRVALSRALDRRALVAVFAGHRVPARGVLGRALGAVHRPAACGANAPPAADPAGAREALRAAGIDLTGARLTLTFNDEFEHRELARAVAEQWRAALGVETTLRGMPWNEYLPAATKPGGLGAAFRMSWAPAYPGPDAVLEPLFHSRSLGADNLSGFSDPAFDRLLEREARRATTEEDRRALYRRLEDIVCEQMPVIPLTFGARAHLVAHARVGSALGVYTDRVWGEPLLRELYLRDEPPSQ